MRISIAVLALLAMAGCTTTHSYYVDDDGGYYTRSAPVHGTHRHGSVYRSPVYHGGASSVFWASPSYGYSSTFIFGYDHFGYSPSYVGFHYPAYMSVFYYDYFYSPRFYASYSYWPRYRVHPYAYAYRRPIYTYPHYYPRYDRRHRAPRATAYSPRQELLRRSYAGSQYQGYSQPRVARRDLVAATQRPPARGGEAAWRAERPGQATASGFRQGTVQRANVSRGEHRASQRPRGQMVAPASRNQSSGVSARGGSVRQHSTQRHPHEVTRMRAFDSAASRSPRQSVSTGRSSQDVRSGEAPRSVERVRIRGTDSRHSSPSSAAPPRAVEQRRSSPATQQHPEARRSPEVRVAPQRRPDVSAPSRATTPRPAPAQAPRGERPTPAPTRSASPRSERPSSSPSRNTSSRSSSPRRSSPQRSERSPRRSPR